MEPTQNESVQLEQNLTFVQKFILFIRQQGVLGLAVAVVLGGAVQKVVTALVTDIINPFIGLLTGKAGDLKDLVFTVGSVKIAWGDFASSIIDFLIIALVIYILVKVLNAGMLDKPKE